MKAALKNIDGVISADVSFSAGEAVVTYDPDKTSPEALVSAINGRTFYRASLGATRRQIALALEGEFDPRRMSRITTRLAELQGVTEVKALPDGRVSVAYDPLLVDTIRIFAAVEGMGYAVLEVAAVSPAQQGESGPGWLSWYWPLTALLALSAILFLRRRRKKWPRPDGSRAG